MAVSDGCAVVYFIVYQCSCVRHGNMCGPGCVNCTDNCENRADSDD